MKSVLLILACASALALLAVPAAQARSCSLGAPSTTTNRVGDVAEFSRLTALSGMNCPSARYVMNKWLRRSYARSFSARLPTRFYDGYVTWRCGRVSEFRWQCREKDSGTRFRFTAAVV